MFKTVLAETVFSPFPKIVGGGAKGAKKASCGETVVQKGVFGESVFCHLIRFALRLLETLKGAEKERTLRNILKNSVFEASKSLGVSASVRLRLRDFQTSR